MAKGDNENTQKNGGVSSRVGPLTFYPNPDSAARALINAVKAYGFKIPKEWKNVNK